MLNTHPTMAFISTAHAERALTFYRDVLGLPLVSDEPFAMVFNTAGAQLRVLKLPSHTPQSQTVFGWSVPDIAAEAESLTARGVVFNRYPGFEQDALGVWTAPSGALVAWFSDPDGNVLSLTQH